MIFLLLSVSLSACSELHDAARSNNVVKIKTLLARGDRLEARDGSLQVTPLHSATIFGHVEAVKALLAAGAWVEARDTKNRTPLHRAVSKAEVTGATETITALVEAGASLELMDDAGVTPLDLAKQEPIRQALLDARAARELWSKQNGKQEL